MVFPKMNNNTKVSEIFKVAGEAFNQLGELTIQLHNTDNSNTYSKWGEEDVELLQTAITNFSGDLNKLSARIKNRTTTQIRQTLTKQVFEEAGIRVQQVNVPQSPSSSSSSLLASPPGSATLNPANNIKIINQVVVASNNGSPIVQQTSPSSSISTAGHHLIHQSPSPTQSSAEVMMTLNRLNAEDTEDQLNADLEFEVEEEVATG